MQEGDAGGSDVRYVELADTNSARFIADVKWADSRCPGFYELTVGILFFGTLFRGAGD